MEDVSMESKEIDQVRFQVYQQQQIYDLQGKIAPMCVQECQGKKFPQKDQKGNQKADK